MAFEIIKLTYLLT